MLIKAFKKTRNIWKNFQTRRDEVVFSQIIQVGRKAIII